MRSRKQVNSWLYLAILGSWETEVEAEKASDNFLESFASGLNAEVSLVAID